MMDSQAKPQNFQQKLQLQRMQHEIQIQKLQRELEERKLQQAKLQQMLAFQQQTSTSNKASSSLSLSPDPIGKMDHGGGGGVGSHPGLKALPMDTMMQALRQRLDQSKGVQAGKGLSDFRANSKFDPPMGLFTPEPSMSQPFDMNSLMPQQKPQVTKPTKPKKHTINITVKRKTKVDVPGFPAAMAKLNKLNQPAKPAKPQPAGISPELLKMLEALRASNTAKAVAPQANIATMSAPASMATAKQQVAQVPQQLPAVNTMRALTGSPTVQQVKNQMSNMINAGVKTQQGGAMSGNMLATAVTASKATNTMADIVDTQMDAMSDMAEAGMGFGMMNMMGGMNIMGGMNMMGGGMGGMSGMGGGLGGMSGMGGGLGGMSSMGGLGGMSGMGGGLAGLTGMGGGLGGMGGMGGGMGGMGGGMGGMGGGMGAMGNAMNRMMTSAVMGGTMGGFMPGMGGFGMM